MWWRRSRASGDKVPLGPLLINTEVFTLHMVSSKQNPRICLEPAMGAS